MHAFCSQEVPRAIPGQHVSRESSIYTALHLETTLSTWVEGTKGCSCLLGGLEPGALRSHPEPVLVPSRPGRNVDYVISYWFPGAENKVYN